MSIADWDKDEIKKLAQESGRPLEVHCAENFLRAKWRVALGTFFNDIASGKIRELDALIEKSITVTLPNQGRQIDWTVTLRVLASCKGFPLESGPATYSVLANSRTVQVPHFMCYDNAYLGGSFADQMSKQCALVFRNKAGLLDRQVVGFDIFRREDISQRKHNKGPAQFEYSRNGDRDLYEGLDSAIKAAAHWFQEDRRLRSSRIGSKNCGIVLNVPLLVTSLPFWDVSIDKGVPDEPQLKSAGFHVSVYPPLENGRPSETVMAIVWDVSKLQELIAQLDWLLEFLVDEAKIELPKA